VSDVLDITSKRSIVSVSLGDVLVEIRNGLVADQEKEQPGIPITRIETISKGIVDLERVRYVRNTDGLKLDRFWLKSGDILFSHINSDLHLGKTAIVMSDAPLLHGMNLLVLRTDRERLLPRYLHHWLDFCRRTGMFMAIAQHAVNQSSLNQKKITSLKIPLPSIDDQEKVVAEIEKQFSRLDEAVANLKRVKANLKRYKASVLKDAVEGRLVPTEAELARRDGRSFETGEQLLQRILEARRSNWSGRGKFKKPDTAETMGPVELPSGWVWASVAQLADVISGLTKNPSRETLPLKLPYLRVANVYANELRLDEMAEIGVADNELQKLLVLKNDLLVVEGNGSPDQIGRVAKWDGSIAPCVHQNHLIKVRAIVAEPDWMLNWLISPGGRKQIELVSSSTTGLHTLSSGKVGRLPIPLPPIAEQKRIVLEIDRRLSLIRGVEVEVDANLRRAQALRQSTLSSAFSH
jgi:type I restriction enzyme, S subunit